MSERQRASQLNKRDKPHSELPLPKDDLLLERSPLSRERWREAA